MLKLLKFLSPSDKVRSLLCLVLVVTQVRFDLRLPDYMSEITRLVQTPGSDMSEILTQGSYMLGCALMSVIAAVAVGFLAAQVAASLSQTIRSELFNRVDSFSTEEINKFSTASLITRSTNDVTQIQLIVTVGLQLMIKAPIMAGWAIYKISGKGHEWTIATIVAIAVLITFLFVLISTVIPKFRRMQGLTDGMNRVTREILLGLRTVRAYNAEDYQSAKFEAANEELTSTQLFTSRGMSTMLPTITMIMSGLSLSIYWIGAYLINDAGMMDKLTIFSNMVVFSAYAVQVIMAFMILAMAFVLLPRAQVSAGRITEVLATEPTIYEGKYDESDMCGEIEFKDVSFKYPDAEEYVLEDISFKAHRGEVVAFIGSTGSGKSTLINLVPRFFDATKGEILIDGINVKDYTQRALNERIGYAPQKALLLRGSVRENVGYGDNPKDEMSIRRALKIAHAEEFVCKSEKGIDSEVSQGGSNFSGGQKQRLSIARAICREPEIYILDDSFSALDYKTDRSLRKALKDSSSDITTLIVAQRVGTIMDADRIIVLDEGKMVGMGTHKELMANCEVYQEIAKSQLSEEELA